MLAILGLVNSVLFLGVLAPFFACVYLRKRAVRGTRQRAAFNAVVVNMRPFIRPAIVIYTAFGLIWDVGTYDGWWRSINLFLDLYMCVWLYRWADASRAEDDDDPWQRRKAALRRTLTRVTPSLPPAGASA